MNKAVKIIFWIIDFEKVLFAKNVHIRIITGCKTKSNSNAKVASLGRHLRSGTLLQSTKLSYRYWYLAIHLMTATKKGFSAHEMKRQLGHKRYEPVWAMMKKIRIYMGIAGEHNLLQGMVEVDDAYMSTYTSQKDKQELKRGKGSQKKTKVTVMAESTPLEINGKKQYHCGQYKMKVNTSETKQAMNYERGLFFGRSRNGHLSFGVYLYPR